MAFSFFGFFSRFLFFLHIGYVNVAEKLVKEERN